MIWHVSLTFVQLNNFHFVSKVNGNKISITWHSWYTTRRLKDRLNAIDTCINVVFYPHMKIRVLARPVWTEDLVSVVPCMVLKLLSKLSCNQAFVQAHNIHICVRYCYEYVDRDIIKQPGRRAFFAHLSRGHINTWAVINNQNKSTQVPEIPQMLINQVLASLASN